MTTDKKQTAFRKNIVVKQIKALKLNLHFDYAKRARNQLHEKQYFKIADVKIKKKIKNIWVMTFFWCTDQKLFFRTRYKHDDLESFKPETKLITQVIKKIQRILKLVGCSPKIGEQH